MTGETPLDLWLPGVVAVLRDRFAGNPGTTEKLVAETQRLFRYLMACGACTWSDVNSTLVTEWCWAARPDRSGRHRSTATSTARNRQWAALAAFEAASSSGAPIDPRTLIGDRIARPSDSESARPLTDGEHRLVQVHADAGRVASRRSVMVALSRAGGTASEVATVRMGDIDLDAGAVEFCGAAARVGPVDSWGVETVLRFVRNNPPLPTDAVVCVTSSTSPHRAAHAVTARLGQVLRDAGIAGRPGVTARSIRLTVAHRVLHTDGIEAAARFLGLPSLDTAAQALGYAWRHSDG